MGRQTSLFDTGETMERGATFSPCGQYRYRLWRIWDKSLPPLYSFMLNPSDAGAEKDDPTSKKNVKFARAWGYGGNIIVNLYALCSPDPDALLVRPYPVAPPDDPLANDRYLAEAAAEAAAHGRPALAAWGSHEAVAARAPHVERLLAESGVELVCLRIAKGGQPWHPLYIPDSQQPIPYRVKQRERQEVV